MSGPKRFKQRLFASLRIVLDTTQEEKGPKGFCHHCLFEERRETHGCIVLVKYGRGKTNCLDPKSAVKYFWWCQLADNLPLVTSVLSSAKS